LGLVWLALAVETAVGALLPVNIPLPEVALLIVLYVGLSERGTLLQLALMAVLSGYLADLASGAPRGLHALSLGITMVAVRSLSSRLLVQRGWQKMFVSGAASLAHGLVVCALSSPPAEAGISFWSRARGVPLAALVTALAAPIVYAWFKRLDARFWPVQRGLHLHIGDA
jgi:rod shape-determining protein MreD